MAARRKIYFACAGNKPFREVDLAFIASVAMEEAVLCNQKSMSWRRSRRGNGLLLVALVRTVGGSNGLKMGSLKHLGCCQILVKLRKWYSVLMKSRDMGKPLCTATVAAGK